MARRPLLIDGTLLVLLAALFVLAGLAWLRGGGELVRGGVSDGAGLLLRYAPVLAVSFLVAGFASALVPHDWVRSTLGADSGLRGILIAAAAGVVTPAGPFVSMPIAAVMVRAGAGAGPVVAFLTGWSLLALHRFFAWEVPILGWRLALLRYATCLFLPLLAGVLARAFTR